MPIASNATSMPVLRVYLPTYERRAGTRPRSSSMAGRRSRERRRTCSNVRTSANTPPRASLWSSGRGGWQILQAHLQIVDDGRQRLAHFVVQFLGDPLALGFLGIDDLHRQVAQSLIGICQFGGTFCDPCSREIWAWRSLVPLASAFSQPSACREPSG